MPPVRGAPSRADHPASIHAGALAGLLFLLTSCTGPTSPVHVGGAADPEAQVPALDYQPVMAGTHHYAPASPAPWRELNDRVSPSGRRSP
jgi:hypothetical protein